MWIGVVFGGGFFLVVVEFVDFGLFGLGVVGCVFECGFWEDFDLGDVFVVVV